MRSLSDANTLLATNYNFQQVEEGEKSILTESNYQIPDFLLTTPQIRQRKDNITRLSVMNLKRVEVQRGL